MLYKSAKPAYRRYIANTAKVLLVFEFIAFGSTYFGWRHFNTNRDFRYKARTDYPWLLEAYYNLGELADKNYKGRSADLEYWRKEGKL